MARYRIPADAFFARSPEISVPGRHATDPTVIEAVAWAQQHGPQAGQVDCFWRVSSNAERDAHLARLQGLQSMYTFFEDLERKAIEYRVYYYGRWVPTWKERQTKGHPCGMLSSNDKLWMQKMRPASQTNYHRANGILKNKRPSEVFEYYHSYAQDHCL